MVRTNGRLFYVSKLTSSILASLFCFVQRQDQRLLAKQSVWGTARKLYHLYSNEPPVSPRPWKAPPLPRSLAPSKGQSSSAAFSAVVKPKAITSECLGLKTTQLTRCKSGMAHLWDPVAQSQWMTLPKHSVYLQTSTGCKRAVWNERARRLIQTITQCVQRAANVYLYNCESESKRSKVFVVCLFNVA